MRPSPSLAEALVRAHQEQDGLLSRDDLRAAGVSDGAVTRAVRSGRLLRVRRGVYGQQKLPAMPARVVADGVLSADVVVLVRAVLMSWGQAAARCRTVALLRGWGLMVEPRTLEIAVPHGEKRRDRLVRVRQVRRVRAEEVVPVTGGAPLRMVPAWHAVLEALLTLPPIEAVALADSALRAGDVVLSDLLERATALPGLRQAAHARRLLAWCDPLSGSVLESMMRYRLHEAGITGFETQVVLSSPGGKRVLRVDFCFAAVRLVVEVDGSRWHDPEKDRLTDNALAAAGWRVLRFSWSDVFSGYAEVIAQVREALVA